LKNVRIKPVDMSLFYSRFGTTMLEPAFKEFPIVPRNWLFKENTDAENYICAQLNMTREQKVQGLPIVRISHNYAELMRLLTPDQLPMTESGLLHLTSALAGYAG
jgi:hypothetical protein